MTASVCSDSSQTNLSILLVGLNRDASGKKSEACQDDIPIVSSEGFKIPHHNSIQHTTLKRDNSRNHINVKSMTENGPKLT